jgi:hypothetical protein
MQTTDTALASGNIAYFHGLKERDAETKRDEMQTTDTALASGNIAYFHGLKKRDEKKRAELENADTVDKELAHYQYMVLKK